MYPCLLPSWSGSLSCWRLLLLSWQASLHKSLASESQYVLLRLVPPGWVEVTAQFWVKPLILGFYTTSYGFPTPSHTSANKHILNYLNLGMPSISCCSLHYTPLIPFSQWKPSMCIHVLRFMCVLAKWCCFIYMYLNFLINVIELHISFGFLPFSLITDFFKFILVAMVTANLLSLDCYPLLCNVHPPHLPIQSPDDGWTPRWSPAPQSIL